MELTEKIKDKFGWFGEWVSIVGPVLAMFLFVHHENVNLTNRLDQHISDIHRRTDELDKKWSEQFSKMDERFYELLKDARK